LVKLFSDMTKTLRLSKHINYKRTLNKLSYKTDYGHLPCDDLLQTILLLLKFIFMININGSWRRSQTEWRQIWRMCFWNTSGPHRYDKALSPWWGKIFWECDKDGKPHNSVVAVSFPRVVDITETSFSISIVWFCAFFVLLWYFFLFFLCCFQCRCSHFCQYWSWIVVSGQIFQSTENRIP